MELTNTLEALLFVAGEPATVPDLVRASGASNNDVEHCLTILAARYAERGAGIRVLRSPEGVQLVTAPDAASAVNTLITAGMRERLTPAAAETLAIVAYRGPISRAAIEAIRGVNSSFTLRLLSLRGLVTRAPHPTDARRFVYEVSADFLRHLGVTAPETLPQYAELRQHEGMNKLTDDAEVQETKVGEENHRLS